MTREPESVNLSDEELVARWRAAGSGSCPPAAAELLGRYRMRIYRWCRAYVRDHDLALDLAQDVLLRVFQNIGSLNGRFGPWVFTVVRNRCIAEIRRQQVRGGEQVDPDTLPQAGPDPEEAWLEQLAEERFLELLNRALDPVEQEAISLRCFEKMPVDMITRVLGITAASGARGVLQAARRKLKAAIEAGGAAKDQGERAR